MLIVYSTLSWRAIATKGVMTDEPIHLVAAWINWFNADDRIDVENPPLWKYWAVAGEDPSKMALPGNPQRWLHEDTSEYSKEVLLRSSLNHAAALLASSRARMLALAIALGAAIACWTWQLAGPSAAAIAVTAYSLCPNFLGHGPVVKNDVPVTLAILLFAWALWGLGGRLTIPRVAAVGLSCAAALGIKYSGLAVVPISVAVLACRAAVSWPWEMHRTALAKPFQRIVAAAVVLLVIALMSWIGIWAIYGFRYRPAPDPASGFSIGDALHFNSRVESQAAHPAEPVTIQEENQWQPGLQMRIVVWLLRHGLIPEAFGFGFLITHGLSAARATFLNGQLGYTGWWWYFPAAILFKTPVATLIGLLTAAIIGVMRIRYLWRKPSRRFAAASVAVPGALFMALAMASHLNIGLRHAFPVYPFLFVGLGAGLGTWFDRNRIGKAFCILLALGLAAETFSAYPDYVAFFNVAIGGPRNGINLLDDSNLDWGQDLPLLGKWHQQHPTVPIYLCYMGSDNPLRYGISYRNVTSSWAPDVPGPDPTGGKPGVLAISATQLQGNYLTADARVHYHALLDRKPIAVLGGTIYLYPYDPSLPHGGLP